MSGQCKDTYSLKVKIKVCNGHFRETHDKATIKCYPTYVSKLPTGKETGRFLALDLGGTNFRVLLIDIGKNKQFSMDSKVFAIPKEIMTGTGDEVNEVY